MVCPQPSKGETEQVRIEFASFDLEQKVDTTPHIEPLLNMLPHHVDEIYRRQNAMDLLTRMPITGEQRAEHIDTFLCR